MTPTDEIETLYRSDTILVRSVPCRNRRRWVVTFDNHSIGPGFDRPGFGEKFLRREGISAIHILGRGDDWYQYPDILVACRIAREAIGPDARRITYGSSMGGYAAIRLADALDADGVLALSPQYSVDPAVVPWETRWEQDASRITWRPELAGPITCRVSPVIVYDPAEVDRRHVEAITRDTATVAIGARHTGHPVVRFLTEVDLLRPLLRRVLNGADSHDGIARKIRHARRTSAVYLSALADRQPASRTDLAITLARMAIAARPENFAGPRALARALDRVGRHDEALVEHRAIVERTKRYRETLIPYAESLAAAGRQAEAVSIAREVVAAEPGRAHLYHWLAWILNRSGDLDAAIESQTMAVTLSPTSAPYRDTLNAYLDIRPQPATKRWFFNLPFRR